MKPEVSFDFVDIKLASAGNWKAVAAEEAGFVEVAFQVWNKFQNKKHRIKNTVIHVCENLLVLHFTVILYLKVKTLKPLRSFILAALFTQCHVVMIFAANDDTTVLYY